MTVLGWMIIFVASCLLIMFLANWRMDVRAMVGVLLLFDLFAVFCYLFYMIGGSP